MLSQEQELRNSIYIDKKCVKVKDILYSVKKYYEDKLYANNMSDLEIVLNNINKLTIHIQDTIDSNINEMLSAPLELIHTNNIIMKTFTKKDINLMHIINYIYKNEIDNIDTRVPNYTFQPDEDRLILREDNYTEYISKEYIVNKIYEYVQTNSVRMKEIQSFVENNIYYDYILKLNINNISQNNLLTIYDCLDIKYVKLVVISSKVISIMKALNTISNIPIPIKFINRRLNKIIGFSRKEGYNIYIEESGYIQQSLINTLYIELKL